MKKIITAINNPKLNEELKKENKFEIICKDIQYKEAILEIIEKIKDVDIIIINEQIPGQINLEDLILKIKEINSKIKLIIILEKENLEIEKMLIKNKIKDIYYNNKINLKELIEIINKKEINLEEEIFQLKKIIENKDINKNKMQNIYFNFKTKIKNNLNNFKFQKNKKINNKKMKIITLSGQSNIGKSTTAIFLSKYLEKNNKKILLIDFNLKKQNLYFLLSTKKYLKNYKNKKIFENNFYNKNNLKQIIKNNEIKINKNIKLISIFDFDFLRFENYKEKNIKNFINKIFETYKKEMDFIIIDLGCNNSYEINKEIIKNSNINLVLMEGNFLGIKEVKWLLKSYSAEYLKPENSLHIIENKYNKTSINNEILSDIFKEAKSIFKIYDNKIYNTLINSKNKNIILNKKIKHDVKKIIKIF